MSVFAEQKSQAIGVIGAVEKPGKYFVRRRFHLLEMLAMAGGPNKESGTRLIVSRTGSTSKCQICRRTLIVSDDFTFLGFKMREIQEGKRMLWMQPGDIVSVLEADIVYVYGNVKQEGAIKIRETTTLTQAIVTAEGLKPAAKKDKIRILRQKGDSGEREELVFDLNQIDKGKIPDPILQPNDIVAVSEDKAKAIMYGFANSYLLTGSRRSSHGEFRSPKNHMKEPRGIMKSPSGETTDLERSFEVPIAPAGRYPAYRDGGGSEGFQLPTIGGRSESVCG